MNRHRLVNIQQATRLIQAGELVAFPTETVYGLAAAIFNEMAVANIFTMKGRPQDNPLIAHISSLDQVHDIADDIPLEFWQLAERFFPGPLTIVLKKQHAVPSIVSAGGPTIAFRMPNHQIAQELIRAVGQPIVAPSANLSGKPSPTRYEHVVEDFQDRIAILDGGPCEIGLESTVLSLLDPQQPLILRPGAITAHDIEDVLKRTVITSKKTENNEQVLSPGMKYRHYAPRAKVRLFFDWQAMIEYSKNRPSLLLSAYHFSLAGHYQLTNQTLYSLYRFADQQKCSDILIFCDEAIMANQALYNRILKSAE